MKIIGFFLMLLTVSACSKKNDQPADLVKPVITINTPFNGQVFTAGQSIPIAGTITDNQYIAEVHIHVSNNLTGTLLMDVHLYPASASTTFNQSITASAGIEYKIQVIAKDKNVNESNTTVLANGN
jgi:Bacterial Ig domain